MSPHLISIIRLAAVAVIFADLVGFLRTFRDIFLRDHSAELSVEIEYSFQPERVVDPNQPIYFSSRLCLARVDSFFKAELCNFHIRTCTDDENH